MRWQLHFSCWNISIYYISVSTLILHHSWEADTGISGRSYKSEHSYKMFITGSWWVCWLPVLKYKWKVTHTKNVFRGKSMNPRYAYEKDEISCSPPFSFTRDFFLSVLLRTQSQERRRTSLPMQWVRECWRSPDVLWMVKNCLRLC